MAATPAPSSKPEPEALLQEIYTQLDASNPRAALAKANVLAETYPTFQLGQLIRGDLLLLQTQRVTDIGAQSGGSNEQLRDFRSEAMVRLNAYRQRPGPDQLPRAILQLRKDQRHVLLVDTTRWRMYVFENRGDRLEMVSDHYVTLGRLGVHKLKEGDDKTPLGVYTLVGHLPGARLPEIYGSGALQINYPNDWDRLQGRSGSGIWVHGTPNSQFSRPPLASNGCVVVSNEEFRKLAQTVELGRTPIIISDKVEWISRSAWEAERKDALAIVNHWRTDLESANAQQLEANYSPKFKAATGEDTQAWFARQRFTPQIPKMALTLRETNLFRYPGNDDMIVGTFLQDAKIGRRTYSSWRRQYWMKEGGRWKLVSEAML